MTPNSISFVSNWMWAIAIAFVLINVAVWWGTAVPSWRRDPSRKRGDQKLLLGFAVVLSLPFLIMGAGAMSKDRLTVWHFFRPQDGNPYVLSFFVYLFSFALIFAIWVWFFGGAKFMSWHVGVFRGLRVTGRSIPLEVGEWTVKAFSLVLLVVYALATMFMMEMEMPPELLRIGNSISD